MKKILTLLTVLAIILGTTIPAYAVTPMYKPLSEYGYTGVPEIEVELSDDIKNAVKNEAQEKVDEIINEEETENVEEENDYISSFVRRSIELYEQYFKKMFNIQ